MPLRLAALGMPHSPAQRGRWADAAPSGSPPRKPPPESAVSPPAPTPSHRATGRPDLVYRLPALRGSPFSPLLPALRPRAHVPSAGSACSPRWGAHSLPRGRAPGKASVREVAGVELGGPSPDWGDSKAGLLPGPRWSPEVGALQDSGALAGGRDWALPAVTAACSSPSRPPSASLPLCRPQPVSSSAFSLRGLSHPSVISCSALRWGPGSQSLRGRNSWAEGSGVTGQVRSLTSGGEAEAPWKPLYPRRTT